ncbi:MAG: translation initiation factor IF-3 [bacterium]
MPSRRRRFRARPKPQPKKPLSNEEIKTLQVRLIGADGQQLGVISTSQARAKAAELGTDLVVVSETSSPPVVRLLDMGKHMYEKRKKQAKQKNKSKGGDIKGIRIGFQMGQHDWQMRLKQASDFLEEGNKVRLEIRLRGRERGRLTLAEKTIHQFIADIPTSAKIEDTISKSPRGLNVLLTR